ncbi:hypothetical protein BM1_10776 [Bipolaris maydis]|nr:hypothetical protein BM1_10776 [Bipolaris maydis]
MCIVFLVRRTGAQRQPIEDNISFRQQWGIALRRPISSFFQNHNDLETSQPRSSGQPPPPYRYEHALGSSETSLSEAETLWPTPVERNASLNVNVIESAHNV